MEPASLSTLSTEILIEICSYFCLHCQDRYNEDWDVRPWETQPREVQDPHLRSSYSLNRHALFGLAVASKRFYSIAQEFLYHEFVLGHGDSWRSEKYSWQGRLGSFMRTMSQRPRLRESIKVVYIRTRLLRGHNHDESRDILKAGAGALGIDLPQAWEDRVWRTAMQELTDRPVLYRDFLLHWLGDPDDLPVLARMNLRDDFDESPWLAKRWVNAELITMLVALLPNLGYLSIQGDTQFPTGGLPESALPALGIKHLPLKKLDLGVHADYMIQLATGLEVLNLHQYRFAYPPPNMPNLKTLRFTKGGLSALELEPVLQACTGGLEVFEYEAGPINEDNGGDLDRRIISYETLDPSDVVRYMEPHSSTLKVFHLDLGQQGRYGRKIHRDLSFKNFEKLEHAYFDTTSLFDFLYPDTVREFTEGVMPRDGALTRLLPSSLVSLAIKHDYMYGTRKLRMALLNLANAKTRQRYPELKCVRSSCRADTVLLESRFEEIGVAYDVGVDSLTQMKPYLNGPNGKSVIEVEISSADLLAPVDRER